MHVIVPGTTEEAVAAIWTMEFDALVLCYSLGNEDAIFLSELFRQFRPRGCMVAITARALPDPRIEADAQIAGTEGPDAIISAIKRKCVVHAA